MVQLLIASTHYKFHIEPSMHLRYNLLIFIYLFILSTLSGQVAGIVFRDYNGNGQRDSSATVFEPGVGNYRVRFYNQSGILDSILTNALGYFYYSAPSNFPLRVEFINNGSYDYDGPTLKSSTGSFGNVQFVSSFPAFLYYGIFYPGDYCDDPDLVLPCYVSGDQLHPSSATRNYDAFVRMKFSYGGRTQNSIVPSNQGGAAPNMDVLAKTQDIGACWGVAYQRKTNTLFTTSTLKRHVGVGPLGHGGLYTINLTTKIPEAFLDLNTIGVPSGPFLDNVQRGIPHTFPPISSDSLAYSMIGKIGYGGIDFNEDQTDLYIISLYTKKLYRIHMGNPYRVPSRFDVDSFAIPDPGCHRGEFRPWALKYYKGKFYVGVVCDGSHPGANFSDLDAWVYSFDPNVRTFTPVLSFDFNYPFNSIRPAYYPWLDEWDPNCEPSNNVYCTHPQAILSDIDFDGPDYMVLGIMDRYGFQGGINQLDLNGRGVYSVLTSGDVLRAFKNPVSGVFEIEHNARSGSIQTSGANSGYGPGGGEYYFGDFGVNRTGVVFEFETANGSIAPCPGKKQTATTATDPFNFNSSGLIFLNNATGNWDRRYQVVEPNYSTYLGKATAIGDLKLINSNVYTEVGNYVWNDLNNNGVQDPIEPPMANVEVQLWQGNALLATAVTDQAGRYLFSNAPEPSSRVPSAAEVYNLSRLLAGGSYVIRVPNYRHQVALNLFAPSPNNQSADHRDSDGVGRGEHVEINFTLGQDGDNNHNLDFGFHSRSACLVSITNVSAGVCNPITNTFNVSFRLSYANTPIGPIAVELSTGQRTIVQANTTGQNQIDFLHIPSRGISNISVKIVFLLDPNCTKVFSNVFDQPESCCEEPIKLCSNRDNLVQLTAIPNMSSYIWYDSTSNRAVGFSEVLIIDKNFFGLEDGYEAYYFVAVDSLGNTNRQECYYRITVLNCCNLKISNFIPLGCDNNGTVNDMSDDWFSLLINATNPDASNRKQYEVIHEGTVLATKPYNSSVVVGNSAVPPFRADGNSTYLLMVRDVDLNECFDTVRTPVSQCPKPSINVQKTIQGITVQSDASYNILYRIRVTNVGDEIGTYSLDDDPGFDDDIEISNAFFTTTIPGRQGASLSGMGPWEIVRNQLIAPGQRHDVFININVKFNADPSSGGDNLYFRCGSSTAVPVRGEALFNRARLDFNNDGVFDKIDTNCTDIPVFEVSKTIHRLRQLSQKAYEVIYLITVTNRGGATGNYSLNDRPAFDDDLVIKQVNYSSNTGANAMLPNSVPLNGWRLQLNRPLAVGAADSFFVLIQFEADLSPSSTGDNIYKKCGYGGQSTPRFGEGLFNVSLLDLNNDGQAEMRDTACSDISIIRQEKEFLYARHLTATQFEVVYQIRVRNSGAGAGIYDLTDLPAFDPDLEIQSLHYVLNHGQNRLPLSFNAVEGYKLVNDKLLSGFSEDIFLLTYRVNLSLDNSRNGNNAYDPCRQEIDGIYKSGYGLFNSSSIDLNNDGLPEQIDTACGDLVFYDLALKKVCLQTSPVKFQSTVVFRSTIFNQGLATAYRILYTDYLPKVYSFDSQLNPGWVNVGNGKLSFFIDSLKPFDSVSIDLVLKIDQLFTDIRQTVNAGEITSFYDNSGNVGVDFDSTPDDDPLNDGTVLPDSKSDNDINGRRLINPLEDEDDHDIAIIPVFDLALKKTIATRGAISKDQIITFNIHVYNQGSMTATRFSVIDYLPSGYKFLPQSNPGWQLQNNELTYLHEKHLVSGDTVIIPLHVLLVGGKKYNDYVNVAELASASVLQFHITNIPSTDWDSTPDKIVSNDAGGEVETPSDDHCLDDGTDANSDGITDEDDHDPAVLLFWDLALEKYLVSKGPFRIGDTVEFGIRVHNQGTVAASEVEVADYLPGGLAMVDNFAGNQGWVLRDGLWRYVYKGVILPSDNAEIKIFLRVVSQRDVDVDYINFAEIVRSLDIRNVDRRNDDIDSYAGSDNLVERGVKPGSQDDGNLKSDDKGGEEDDHDPAGLPIYDIALKMEKQLRPELRYGDTVCFDICLYNQGNQPVKNIALTNYISKGFDFIPQVGWTYNPVGQKAIAVVKDTLDPGDSLLLPIKLRLISHIGAGNPWCNLAEVMSTDDLSGKMLVFDFDSDFDMNSNNDLGGVPNSQTDNHISDDRLDGDGNGIVDEDDHDPACVDVLDFALRKLNRSPNAVNPNDDVQFVIYIFNQGNVPVKQLELRDYLNAAFDFVPNDNPGWIRLGNTLFFRLNSVLPPGAIDSAVLILKLNQRAATASADELCNWAEIGEIIDLSDRIRTDDADSYPGSDSPVERSVKPNDDNDNVIVGNGPRFRQDEDDHDVAGAGGFAALGDMVWHDRNGNGRMENGEEGLKGVVVQLIDFHSKRLVRSQSTNDKGKYYFDRVAPGKYFLKFIFPTPYLPTKANLTIDSLDSDLDNGNGTNTTSTIMLMPNQLDLTWDLGLYLCAKVSGFVWLDEDFDGYYDSHEKGINGREINAFSWPDKALVAKVKTSNFINGLHTRNGSFDFCLEPGTYYLHSTASKSMQTTIPFVGSDRQFDSDFTNANGFWTTDHFRATSGAVFEGINLGLIRILGMESDGQSGNVIIAEKLHDTIGNGQHPPVLRVIPNPADQFVEIVIEHDENLHADIEVHDPLGKLILSKTIKADGQGFGTRFIFPIADVAPGQYHLFYKSGAVLQRAKLIILR